MNEKTAIRRIPPCPAHDIEAMESWLMDMARAGWMLEKDGYSCGMANFQKAEPQETLYRLVGFWKPPTTGQLLGVSGSVQYPSDQPEEEALELNWLYGWAYVAKRGKYFIYRSVCENPRELDTDPLVQSMTIRAAAQWDRVRFLWGLIALLPLFLQPRSSYTFLQLLAAAPLFYISTLLFSGFLFAPALLGYLHGTALAKRLKENQPLDHHKNWREGAPSYRLRQVTTVLVCLLYVVAAGYTLFG